MKQIYCAMTNILLCTAQKNAREKKTETNLRVKNYFVKISTFGWYYSMLYSDEHSHQMNIFGHVLLYGMGGWVWVSVFLFIAVDIRRVWLKHKTLNKFLAIYQEPSHCAHRSSVHRTPISMYIIKVCSLCHINVLLNIVMPIMRAWLPKYYHSISENAYLSLASLLKLVVWHNIFGWMCQCVQTNYTKHRNIIINWGGLQIFTHTLTHSHRHRAAHSGDFIICYLTSCSIYIYECSYVLCTRLPWTWLCYLHAFWETLNSVVCTGNKIPDNINDLPSGLVLNSTLLSQQCVLRYTILTPSIRKLCTEK